MPKSFRLMMLAAILIVVSARLTFSVDTGAAQTVGLQTVDLGGGVTPQDLADLLVDDLSVRISNVHYTGASTAAGTFRGDPSILGVSRGVVLSTGAIKNVVGPNVSDSISQHNGRPGDGDLDGFVPGSSTYDAASLEFDFVPTQSLVSFRYVFASDEYNEFANTGFTDVVAILIDGTNVARVPGTNTPVSTNSINGGNPLGTNAKNPSLFRNNDLNAGGGSINTEMDGLTVVLTVQVSVSPGVTHHMKLAIADVGDGEIDSNVFIEAGSIRSPTPTSTPSPTRTSTQVPAETPTPRSSPTSTPSSTPTPRSITSPVPTDTPTPRSTIAATGQDREETKRPRLSEEQRQQKARSNRLGSDDYRTEGNVIEVDCGTDPPHAVIGTRDGLQKVQLLNEARSTCQSVQPGDYLEADGAKQHELLFDADTITVQRIGKR